jgi:hypothetical protein
VSRAKRREKAEGELEHLEARLRARLIAALHHCAHGHWGLFGQNDAAERAMGRYRPRLTPVEVGELLQLGEEIDALRSSLGYSDGNALFARLKAYRRLPSASAPAEPRLAQQFLAELDDAAAPGGSDPTA